jgi:hypothetical protein
MRIIVAGDRFWNCDQVAENIVRRLVAHYGSDIVIALGGGPGVDQSFSMACRRLGVTIDLYLADLSHLGDDRFGNRELLRRGAGLCILVHRSTLDEGSRDLAQQAIAAGVPTYLIDSEHGNPRRLVAGDAR